MNQREHVVNALLLSLGLGVLAEPALTSATALSVAAIGPPVVLGALFPDVDATVGRHRRTFHNVWVLGVAYAFPVVFDNLHLVWIGLATHYVLDLLGTDYGMGLLYPHDGFYDVPVGVDTSSPWALPVTLAVTALELGAIVAVATLGLPVAGTGRFGAALDLARSLLGA